MTRDRDTLLNQCFDEAERRAPELLKRCIDSVMNSLQLAEEASLHNAQRQLFARATWSIAQCRGALVAAYPRRLRDAFERQDQDPSSSSTMTGLFNSSMMQLVDDSAMNETLEAVRLLQNLLPLVEQSLPILDARMSSLIGLDTIEVEKNPLRPSVFARELRELMAEFESDAEIRVLWLQHMAHVLGRELGQFYESLASMLQQANVQEAGYRIRLVEDPETSRASGAPDVLALDMLSMDDDPGGTNMAGGRGGGGSAASAVPEMKALGRSRSDLDSEVFQTFLSASSEGGAQALNEEYYEQVRQELRQIGGHSAPSEALKPLSGEALRTYRATAVVDRPRRVVSVDMGLDAELWGHYGQADERTRVLLELKARAKDAAQAMGLDLVRKLVNQVARDPLLLAPVREAVVALEPSLLRLALAQPRYFAEADHPARLLVEEVAQRSFRFNDEFADDFLDYLRPVRDAFQALNARKAEEPEPFTVTLDGLRKRWHLADAAEHAARDAQVDALRFAESRQQLADQIAWEISLRPDVFNAPALVLDFFYGTWSLVMATVQLSPTDGAPSMQECRTAVGTLLWSVRPETMRQSKAVFETLPGLLQCLHAGLDTLGMSKTERQPFFDGLMRMHQPLLKLRRLRVKGDIALSGPGDLDDRAGGEPIKRELSVAPRVFVTEQPWMAQKEWTRAGFEGRRESALDDSVAQALREEGGALPVATGQEADSKAYEGEAPPPKSEDAGAMEGEVMARLHPGCLVDLFSQDEWIRAELVWASARGTLFMFSSAGGRAHSMTLRVCEKLIRKQWLRMVDTHAVVDKAVQAVAGDAISSGRRQAAKQRRKTPLPA